MRIVALAQEVDRQEQVAIVSMEKGKFRLVDRLYSSVFRQNKAILAREGVDKAAVRSEKVPLNVPAGRV